jgi:integrase/recombinase XerD
MSSLPPLETMRSERTFCLHDPPRSAFPTVLRERRYLKNVTPKTCLWYESAWKAFTSSRQGTDAAESVLITRADLSRFVVHLRERGVRPVSCNTWLRALNAFCRWVHEQGEIPTAAKLPPQRLERRLIATHAEAVLRAIVAFRPRTFCECRVHTLVVTILDTGCRIEELLTTREADFDFDNLTVYGKGR